MNIRCFAFIWILGEKIGAYWLNLKGGWVLSSPAQSFGGFSALEYLPDGRLLALSDKGYFIFLNRLAGFVENGFDLGAPVEDDWTVEIIEIGELSQEGNCVEHSSSNRKMDLDAEGMAMIGSTIYVSFENRFRIEKFDLSNPEKYICGERVDIPVGLPLPEMDSNNSAEALKLGGADSLIIGMEDKGRVEKRVLLGSSVYQTVLFENYDAEIAKNYGQVGMSKSATLFRYWKPGTGNYIAISFADHEDLTITDTSVVRNFEGIAEFQRSDESRYYFLISDDNYAAPAQETRLYIFEKKFKTP